MLIELRENVLQFTRSGSLIALSGILDRQADDVRLAYSGSVDWQETRHREGWVLLVGRRR